MSDSERLFNEQAKADGRRCYVHSPVNLPEFIKSYDAPGIIVLCLYFDIEGCQQGDRINGFVQCPKCDLWWPRVEEPDMWSENEAGQWIADGWWGGTVCESCGLLMVEQPDGTPECYVLNRKE